MEYTKLQPIPSSSTSFTSSQFNISNTQIFSTDLVSTDEIGFSYTSSLYADDNLLLTTSSRFSVRQYDSASVVYGDVNTNIYSTFSVDYEINNGPTITPNGSIESNHLVEWYNFIYTSASYYIEYAVDSDVTHLSSSVNPNLHPLRVSGQQSGNPYSMENIYFDSIQLNKYDTDLTDSGDMLSAILSEPVGSTYDFTKGITIESWVQFISGSDTLPNKNQIVGISNDADPQSNRNNTNCFIERNSNGTTIYANLMDVTVVPPIVVTEQQTTPVSISLDEWYHLALTYQYTSDGPNNQYDLKLFINGVETGSLSNANLGWEKFIGDYGNYAPYLKGGADYDNKRTQPCLIGQIRLYNVPVSASVITNNYNAESNIYS